MKPLVRIDHLNVFFSQRKLFSRSGQGVCALSDISIDIQDPCTFGIVGESGSGKSTLARVISGAIQPTSGFVNVLSLNPYSCTPKEKCHLQRCIRMVFQDPAHSFNPRYPVRDQLREIAKLDYPHFSYQEMINHVEKNLIQVGLDPSCTVRYPHELSLGQLQRSAIARAISSKPRLLIMDESLSALDVTVQVQILDLIHRLHQEEHLSLLFISHDLRLVRACSDQIAVMRNGSILECGSTKEVLASPKNPYTELLIKTSRLGC